MTDAGPTPATSANDRKLLAELLPKFEDAWKASERPKLEDFINDARVLATRESFGEKLFRDLLQIELRRRERLHETVSVEEYFGRFPRYLDIVAECFAAVSRKIGEYRLLKLLGTGGMGEVYLALNELTDQTGALKVIRGDLAADTQAVARFMREIKSLAKINHPNVVAVRTAGRADGTLYLEMEYVDGISLDEIYRRVGQMSVPDTCAAVCQTADALEHAHSQFVLHRDLKPHNLMLTSDGMIKVLDFGLAKWRRESPTGHKTSFETAENATLGTPHFMAPEQLNAGAKSEPATDVYGLGATLYFLLTGETPIAGENFLEIIASLATRSPRPILEARPELPTTLSSCVMKMLAKNPNERYASMREIRDKLAPFSRGSDLATLHMRAQGTKSHGVAGAPWTDETTSIRIAPTEASHDSAKCSASPALAVGIDLGTTYSVVAFVDSSGRPTTILNKAGDLLTPSALLVDDEEIVVGKEAVKAAVIYPEAFAECVKRDMGKERFRQPLRGVQVPPEILSALILERLKQDAERQLGVVDEAVITVPAFFDETRRKATQDAGHLAGLKVLDIINEPTAAAVAFGHQHGFLDATAQLGRPMRVLVYDLGGGTFDVTILEISRRLFRTLATDGDVQLGGKDFDERIANYLADRFAAVHGFDPRNDAQDAIQLWQDAQEAKHALTDRTRTTVLCTYKGMRARIELTRAEFADLTRDLLERTESTTSLCLQEAQLDWHQIDRVLVVGGATRMPMVSEMLCRVSGKKPDQSLSPDEVVAHGAALYAAMLRTNDASNVMRGELLNVNSHSLGIVGLDPQTRLRISVVLIPKNSQLPCHAARVFQTAKADQRDVKIFVVEGESHQPDDCVAIGQCVIRDLPPGLPQGTPIHVEYSYAANGRISVTARMAGSRQSAHVEIERRTGRELGTLASWRKRLLDAPRSSAIDNL